MSTYGKSNESCDKKLNRITVSFSHVEMEAIVEIAKSKNINNSDVVWKLARIGLQEVVRQKGLIAKNPIAVAFDICT